MDVSTSMKRNWKNEAGKGVPKIELIRDVLNKQARNFSLNKGLKKKQRSINLFCLGMGFKRTVYLSKVDLTYDHEKNLEDKAEKRTLTNAVCDIIALSEMLPTKLEINQLKRELNTKWNKYADELLIGTEIDEKVYEYLKEFILLSLRSTAYKKLQATWRYQLYLKYTTSHTILKSKLSQWLYSRLSKFIANWEAKIEKVSIIESEKYFKNILNKTKEIFEQNKASYETYIANTLQDFCENHSAIILKLFSIGYSSKDVMNYFNESKARQLAEKIYQHLRTEVVKSIQIAWLGNKIGLLKANQNLKAQLDTKKVKQITEQCIQKYGWGILKPFVEAVVIDVFNKSLELKAKEMLPEWIGLASSREITRSIREIGNILPESFEETIYSDEFMFGTTPMESAMEQASARLLDPSIKNRVKILIIISDGEFLTDLPGFYSQMLQKVGVTVICGYITNSNIITTLIPKSLSRWPDGAKKMHQMSSEINDENEFIKEIKKHDLHAPDKAKMFYQLNNTDELGKLIEALTIEED